MAKVMNDVAADCCCTISNSKSRCILNVADGGPMPQSCVL